jgi:hypothetical protein
MVSTVGSVSKTWSCGFQVARKTALLAAAPSGMRTISSPLPDSSGVGS